MVIEIRRNPDNTLDEIVTFAPIRALHLEQKASNHWWLMVQTTEGDVHVNLHSRTRITAMVEDERGL